MSDRNRNQRPAAKAATAEDDRALKAVTAGFITLIVLAASSFVAFPSLGAVFLDSYKSQYAAKVSEAEICRF